MPWVGTLAPLQHPPSAGHGLRAGARGTAGQPLGSRGAGAAGGCSAGAAGGLGGPCCSPPRSSCLWPGGYLLHHGPPSVRSPFFLPNCCFIPPWAVLCVRGHPCTALPARGGQENSSRRTGGHGWFPTCETPVPPGSGGWDWPPPPGKQSRQLGVLSPRSGRVLRGDWRASHALLLSTSKGATSKEPQGWQG